MTPVTPPEDSLDRLEVLREFKRRMPQTVWDTNVSPFDDRVSTAAGGPTAADLPDMHAGVRTLIRDTIADVGAGRRQSQVILISGAAGTGKTHLLRTFQTPAAVAELGHLFVGGSNHWRIAEFEARLLDWVIEALTAPTPTADHPLLDRVRAIGFRAVEHLLNNPVSWKTCLVPPRGGIFGRLARRWARPSYDRLQKWAAARDPRVFRYFDFARFSAYVCDRFLADRSNVLHRYALRVLLLYLFPDGWETGVGTRERVLHWFRGTADDAYFADRLGARERPDRAYSQIEALKLLIHLFSPGVSAQLGTAAEPCPPRVFLLTFDQAEGRNELFDTDADWTTFFAHLSELYNTLPNVVVLFTMTLGLRNRLHGTMERQFQERIRMDENLTLRFPSNDQVRLLYQSRVRHWLRNDPLLGDRYAGLANPYLPFDPDTLVALGGNQTARDALAKFDAAFRQEIRAVTVDAAIDYLFERNERKRAEEAATEWTYTVGHVSTLAAFLDQAGPLVAADAGIEVRERVAQVVENVPVLRFTLGLPGQPQTIMLSLARVGFTYNTPIAGLVQDTLFNREKARTFLYVVRSQRLPPAEELVEPRYVSQFVPDLSPVAVESTFGALAAVCANRDKYPEAAQKAALDELVLVEVRQTYLAELFGYARVKLEALTGTAVAAN